MTTPKPAVPLTIAVHHATIGKDTQIRRALPHRQKRMIGAWCFLDHIGPAYFEKAHGLDIGPHPHIGLQTFTWMIKGELMHSDSLGYRQLIRPGQVNLMTAGRGISHTEVTPEEFSGETHATQLWIAQPESERHNPPRFEHYANLPHFEQDGLAFTLLVGEFLGHTSPVQVATPLIGIDITTNNQPFGKSTITLHPEYEYGILLLEGNAIIQGVQADPDQLLYFAPGSNTLEVELQVNARILLIGGVPFEAPIIIWWNLVARTSEEIKQALSDWNTHHTRFGSIPSYPGKRMEAPPLPVTLVASK